MWLMQFFKAGFHFALSFLKGVLSFIAPPIMRALESLAEIIGVRKNETIEDRVKFEYEAHHGPGSLWFSGETERKKDETSTNYLARRYSQAIGGLMAANEVKKIRKQYIKANAGRIVFTGAVTGAIVALALTSFQGWLQLWAVAAAAVVL